MIEFIISGVSPYSDGTGVSLDAEKNISNISAVWFTGFPEPVKWLIYDPESPEDSTFYKENREDLLLEKYIPSISWLPLETTPAVFTFRPLHKVGRNSDYYSTPEFTLKNNHSYNVLFNEYNPIITDQGKMGAMNLRKIIFGALAVALTAILIYKGNKLSKV